MHGSCADAVIAPLLLFFLSIEQTQNTVFDESPAKRSPFLRGSITEELPSNAKSSKGGQPFICGKGTVCGASLATTNRLLFVF